jgi:hypothetical protein
VEKLNEEAGHWNALRANQAQVKMLGGHHALVMPYIRPLRQEELHDEGKMQAVKEAAKHMVDVGLCHDDMSLRNVGFVSPQYVRNSG